MAPSSIFLSLGTHEAPFSRAVELVVPLANEGCHVLIQNGATPAQHHRAHIQWQDYMPYGDIIKTMTTVEMVVCHAGVGTIMTALKLGHRPIVIPRLQRYGEHVDDHQCDIAGRLAERGLVTCYSTGQSLSLTDTRRASPLDGDFSRAGEQLRMTVADAVAGPARKRRPRLFKAMLGS
jgi:UDP-N-acetylglucosamine transferase subunit ALG13